MVLLSELYFANRVALIFVFFSFLLLLILFLNLRTGNTLVNNSMPPIQVKSSMEQGDANSSFRLRRTLYSLIIFPLTLPILFSQFRNANWILHHQLPVGSLTPDAQFAVGYANHIRLTRDVSSFNVDGITTPYYTGIFSTLATFNSISPMNDKFDLIIFSWLGSVALFLALFRFGKILFPGIDKLIILFAALSPFSLSAWPFTKNGNDVGAQSIGLLELIPSATLATYLFVSSLIKLVEIQELYQIEKNRISPVSAAFKIAPLGINMIGISCLKPSVGYVVLTFFFIYGVLTSKANRANILSYSCLLLSASLFASNRFVFPSTEGVSFSFLSHLRLLLSPFAVITFSSMLIALFLKDQLYKRNVVVIALQMNAVIWSLFVVNSQFTAQGRNTIYGLIPLVVSSLLPLCFLGIVSLIVSNSSVFNSFPSISYLYVCAACFYLFFEFSLSNQRFFDSPENRRLILVFSFIFLLLFVTFIHFFNFKRRMLKDIKFRFFVHLSFLALIVLGTSNFKNTYMVWDFRSDEVKSRPEYIAIYSKREDELKEISEILKFRKIQKYATNSWCRYLPNRVIRFDFEPYGCDTRAFEVSSMVMGTPRLGGWSYDYKYGRSEFNDKYIEVQIGSHDRLWDTEDVSKFWSELGVSALILDREMPVPKVDITKFAQFQNHHFILYIKD